MLKVKPKINVSTPSNYKKFLTVFILIDCDAGPMELTNIYNLSEFYIKYQSKRKTLSYNLAILLLELGYNLQLLRVKKSNNKPSLMLHKNPLLYSYPDESTEYFELYSKDMNSDYMNINWIKSYGFTIKIPKDGITLGDYILINTGSNIWYNIHYGGNQFLNPNMYYRTYDLNDKLNYSNIDNYNNFNPNNIKSTVNALMDVIRTRTGFKISNYKINDDGSADINCYSTELQLLPETSLSKNLKVINNEFIDYDVLCQYILPNKTIEFYSKYDDANSYLECNIDKLGNIYENGTYYKNYNITISKLDENGLVLYSESYYIDSKNGTEYNEQLFNINSELVTCKIADIDNIPNGTWKFGRQVVPKDAELGDYINIISIDNKTQLLREYSSDVLLDTCIDSYTEDSYSYYLKSLEKLASTNSLLFTNYNINHYYDKNCEALFSGEISINAFNYPSYIVPLITLAKTKDIEGKLSGNLNYSNNIIENPDNLEVITIDTSNYELKLINPMVYFINSVVSMDLCLKTVYSINQVRRDLKGFTIPIESDVQYIVSEVVNSQLDIFSSKLNINIDSIDIDDRTCKLILSTELEFNRRRSFELVINLKSNNN